MSIESLLAELVSSVEGATGAIVLGADGEAVGFYSEEGDRTRLPGAYVSLMLRDRRASLAPDQLGKMRGMVVEYEGGSLVANKSMTIALSCSSWRCLPTSQKRCFVSSLASNCFDTS